MLFDLSIVRSNASLCVLCGSVVSRFYKRIFLKNFLSHEDFDRIWRDRIRAKFFKKLGVSGCVFNIF
ncbi:hypothetical protein CKA32_000563 [Geitlerinema sp. FC II]|nr:hypothetical protein CKA32_000563 [Geitlerinema sp. FC II]